MGREQPARQSMSCCYILAPTQVHAPQGRGLTLMRVSSGSDLRKHGDLSCIALCIVTDARVCALGLTLASIALLLVSERE